MQNKMYLSEKDNKLTGVCGGIAEFFGFNSTVLRVIFVLFILMDFASVPIYIALIFLMPNRKDEKIKNIQ
ncbi:PspC domain-containing protein [Romboutsia weinsteinii]|uniref:PspC domain-containing protein n=1 Tax=Romboutsia weinsteinii TaxID=2020949 RepID=A0A371J658_9FIRM|nr:PspC domain-containing protein [Romboutsia weinsteinii]RDY28146.1 PspC domain-containing protein [Romboutsia weinsteinii]